jgi:hypothetical protein
MISLFSRSKRAFFWEPFPLMVSHVLIGEHGT